MRRLPIYFLCDVSESMVGMPIEQMQEGMRSIIQDLRVDPYALETVFVSIIAFAGKARVLSPLTELYKFYPPKFPIGGGTSLGAALDALMDNIDASVQKTTMEQKGDWQPIVFLFTDGNPTDNYRNAFRRWNDRFRNRCNLIAVSIGDNVNVGILGEITDNVLLLKDTDAESFSQFFKWVSSTIKISSVSVSEGYSDDVKLPAPTGINLEKVEPGRGPVSIDENFVVLHGRCQTTGRDYLVKYAKRHHDIKGVDMFKCTDYRLLGAYPIDGESYASLSDGGNIKINTMELVGVPTCPCCGNQHGVVVCECGGIFCVGENVSNVCPWCGLRGDLCNSGPNGMDINRGIG